MKLIIAQYPRSGGRLLQLAALGALGGLASAGLLGVISAVLKRHSSAAGDDRYFNRADRLIKLDCGRIAGSVEPLEEPVSPITSQPLARGVHCWTGARS